MKKFFLNDLPLEFRAFLAGPVAEVVGVKIKEKNGRIYWVYTDGLSEFWVRSVKRVVK